MALHMFWGIFTAKTFISTWFIRYTSKSLTVAKDLIHPSKTSLSPRLESPGTETRLCFTQTPPHIRNSHIISFQFWHLTLHAKLNSGAFLFIFFNIRVWVPFAQDVSSEQEKKAGRGAGLPSALLGLIPSWCAACVAPAKTSCPCFYALKNKKSRHI